MEFLQKVIQLYAERKEWFLDLFAAHVGLALTAAGFNGGCERGDHRTSFRDFYFGT